MRIGSAVMTTKKRRLTKAGKYVTDSYESKPKPRTKQRECLCCGKVFNSAGPQNRLCYKCGNQSTGPFDI